MSSVLTKTPALSRMTLAVPVSDAAAALRASQMTAHCKTQSEFSLLLIRGAKFVEKHFGSHLCCPHSVAECPSIPHAWPADMSRWEVNEGTSANENERFTHTRIDILVCLYLIFRTPSRCHRGYTLCALHRHTCSSSSVHGFWLFQAGLTIFFTEEVGGTPGCSSRYFEQKHPMLPAFYIAFYLMVLRRK